MIADLAELEEGKIFLSENLRNPAASMAQITPQVDFINLFCEVTSSLPILQNSGPVCADYIVNDLKVDVGPEPRSDTQVTYRADDCNCNWSCGQQLDNCPAGGEILSPCSGGATSGCCNLVGGCGLFLLGTCDGKVECAEI
jgi:hypothetical protein